MEADPNTEVLPAPNDELGVPSPKPLLLALGVPNSEVPGLFPNAGGTGGKTVLTVVVAATEGVLKLYGI